MFVGLLGGLGSGTLQGKVLIGYLGTSSFCDLQSINCVVTDLATRSADSVRIRSDYLYDDIWTIMENDGE